MNKDLLDELLDSSVHSKDQQNFVFFNDKNPEGGRSKKDFIESLRRQKQSDKSFRVNHLKSLVDNMSLRRKIIGLPRLTDDDGQQVIWVRFSYGNVRQNLQILNECGMYDFIQDYASGTIRNIPNFEELIKSISQD